MNSSGVWKEILTFIESCLSPGWQPEGAKNRSCLRLWSRSGWRGGNMPAKVFRWLFWNISGIEKIKVMIFMVRAFAWLWLCPSSLRPCSLPPPSQYSCYLNVAGNKWLWVKDPNIWGFSKFSLWPKCDQICNVLNSLQGAPKKMYHSDLYPISVLEVGFYNFTYALES